MRAAKEKVVIKRDLRREIGNAIKALCIKSKFKVHMDTACGGDKYLPFFITNEKTNKMEITNADILIEENFSVKLICDIEESNRNPSHVMGRVLSIALADSWAFKTYSDPIPIKDEIVFLHVISMKDIPINSSKEFQWMEIMDAINAKNLFKGRIKSYHIVCGNPDDFREGKPKYNEIKKILKLI
jgi:hypothetical protein